jgi:hypothetical protein
MVTFSIRDYDQVTWADAHRGESTGVDATAVWALMIIGGFVVLALLGLAVLAERPPAKRPDPAQFRAAAEELVAHAAAAQADAGRAVAIADEAREQVAAAERARDDAWAAQEAAEGTYETALAAAIAGREAAAQLAAAEPDGDGADREREVSRAALSAYRRGDISVHELREVWRRAGEWDPAQEEREHAAERCRLQLAAARRIFDRAAAVVRRADQAARVAEVAAQALVDEAAQSAVEAHEVLLATERYDERPRPRRPRKRAA